MSKTGRVCVCLCVNFEPVILFPRLAPVLTVCLSSRLVWQVLVATSDPAPGAHTRTYTHARTPRLVRGSCCRGSASESGRKLASRAREKNRALQETQASPSVPEFAEC
jgi:hypothetical protein